MATLHGFRFVVVVNAETQEQAEQVMLERICFEEDYGFPYDIGHYLDREI